ncbi:ATP-binding protein [Actinomadura scrupuli]|uniref:ATP-binding protein n=1 Tax=Actinomadura scrupuli TaxID=559629 RepID=UPI003D967B48
MEQYQFAAALSCLAAGVVVLAVLLVRQWQITISLRRRETLLNDRLYLCEEEVRHLVDTRLPELMDSLHGRPVTVSGPLYQQRLRGTVYEQALQRVMDLFAESVERTKTRSDRSAKATLRTMMRAVQSLASEQQLAISAMQNRHDDPEVLEGLLKIDHMNAQLGRRAQATAVLCGSWPGQQRSASALGDVARGAISRIRDYLRVNVHARTGVAVVSRAVEPVVLALAELLDNAGRHSPPDTSVEVNVQPAHNGVAILVDDAGVAMDAEELRHAERLLSGKHPVLIDKLGDPPQIGFAVAGVLAERYGFTVSVDTRSPYGGVRAVMFLPAALLTRATGSPEPAVATGAVTAPAPRPGGPASPAPASTAGGLPRRRRAEAAGPVRPAAPAARNADPLGRPARQTAAGMGAWQRGTRSGRAVAPLEGEGKDLRP